MSTARLLLPFALLATATFVAGGALAAKPEATVGSITENNGLSKSGHVLVRTPSILRIGESTQVPPDPRKAIAQYDAVIDLPGEPAVRAEAMRRSAYLRLTLAEAADTPDEGEVRKAAAIYRRLLAEIPGDASNDRALYQLARAYQLLGEPEPASDALRRLGRDYPNSLLAADSHFRAAELLFLLRRYAEAESEYALTLRPGEGAPFFAQAQYKYAWALYQQDKFAPALAGFLAVLERQLPPGELSDTISLTRGTDKTGMAADALRATDLSAMALGGGPALGAYFDTHGGEPRYTALLYRSLAGLQLDKHRYSDAATSFSAFATRHPNHPLSPSFQSQAIDAYASGGFAVQAMAAKAAYVDLYNPRNPHWGGQQPPAEVMLSLRKHLEDLGRYHQAAAQTAPAGDAKRTEFAAAATFYRNLLAWFPQDPQAAQINLLYADALLDSGDTAGAAQQYSQTAYQHPADKLAPEAAYAAVQAWQKLAGDSAGANKAAALRQSVDASLKLADTFPAHVRWGDVLATAAGNLVDLGDQAQAISVATRALDSGKPMEIERRRDLLGLIADSQFAMKEYARAESSYAALLKIEVPGSPTAHGTGEQLAASIYKQGEQARAAGDLRLASQQFLRIGGAVPDASIRATADYDAASALMDLQAWPEAETVLEAFRARFPTHTLLPAADKKLALAYQKDGKNEAAAGAYARIAQRKAESDGLRLESAWLAAQLYDQAGLSAQSAHAYENYLSGFSGPLNNRLHALRRLADIARNDRGDGVTYLKRLQELVATETGGKSGDAGTHLMAAQAELEIGRAQADQARAIALRQPLAANLSKRKQAMEAAIGSFLQAAHYDLAEITPAASYEIGRIYRDFSAALLDSERPAKLSGEEREQYDVLLEEQADPFELKAIAAHESNLERVPQGLWNDWIRRSTTQLAELAPAKYGKHETNETIYEDIR